VIQVNSAAYWFLSLPRREIRFTPNQEIHISCTKKKKKKTKNSDFNKSPANWSTQKREQAAAGGFISLPLVDSRQEGQSGDPPPFSTWILGKEATWQLLQQPCLH
jgi:hypothetical protein